MTGGGTLLSVDDDGVVTGSIGVGTITQEVKVPCAGTYQVAFNTTSDLSIKVLGASKSEFKGGVVTFVVEGKGGVTFEVSSTNAAQGFVFSTGPLEIVCDFGALRAKMTAALNNASNIAEITADPDSKLYPDAAELKKALEGERKAQLAKVADTSDIKKLIDAIVETGDAEKDLATYEKYKLYADPNEVQKAIDEIAGESKIVSDKIKNFNVNFPALVGLDGGMKTLEETWKTQSDRIAATAVADFGKAEGLDEEGQTAAAAYVNSTCSKGVQDAKTALDKYKAEIAKTYATDKLTTKITFKPNPDAKALQTTLNTLKGSIDTAYQSVADYAAVYGVNGLLAEINKTAKNAENTVLDIKSVPTPDSLLDKDGSGAWPIQGAWSIQQANWLKEIQEDLGKADNSLKKTTFENATKSLAANKKAYDDAENAINKVVAAANALSTDQNGAMSEAFDDYEGVYKDYNTAANAEAVEAYYKAIGKDVPEDYTEKVSDAEKALQKLKDVIITNYSKLELDKSDYSDALADAQAAVSDLQNVTGNIKPNLDAQSALNDFVKYLEEKQKNLANENIPDNFLVDKFKGNIDALQQAVIAVESESEGENVQNSIKNNKNIADQLIDALNTAYEAYSKYHSEIEWLKNNCKTGALVDGTKYDLTALTKAIEEYSNQDSEWKTKYEGVAALDPEPCYEAAKKLGDEINGAEWEIKVIKTFKSYINDLTEADYNIVDGALKEIAEAIPSLTVSKPDKDGKETSPYLIAKKALDDIKYQDAINLSSDDKDKKLKACNTVIEQLQNLWTSSVSGMYGNVVDYKALKKQIDEQLGTPLDELNALIDGYKESAAYSTYQAWSKDLKDKLESLSTALDSQLETLLVTANKATTQAGIDAANIKNGKSGSIDKDILKNESAHDAELEASRGALAAIIQALAAIQENAGASEFATEWIDQLMSLRDNDLEKADKKVADAYKAGDCFSQDSGLLEAYDKIIAAVNDIKTSFDGGWDTLVAERNNSLLNDYAWNLAQYNMNAVYVDAINAFNAYVGLNEGYTATKDFQDVVTNNAKLFDYAAASRKLINQVTHDVNEATDKGQALTDQEFKEIAYDKADAIINEMKDAAAKMIADFNEAGKAYYDTLLPEAEQAMSDAAALLQGYGYSATDIANILKDYNEVIDDQKVAYADAEEVPAELYDEDGKLNYKATVGYAMGDIADALDGVIDYNLNPQVIAKDWTPTYNKYVNGNASENLKGFTALAAELETYKNITAISEIFNAQSAIFNTNKTNAENLNANIGNIGNLLSDEDGNGKTLVQEQKDKLVEYYNKAAAAVQAVKTAADNNQTVTGFDTALTTATNDLSALKNIITLAGPAEKNVSIKDAEDAFKVFDTTLGNFKNKIATESDVTTAKNAAESAVNTALNAAYLAERNYLVGEDPTIDVNGILTAAEGSLLNTLKVAYNDAYAKDSGVEAEYLAQVDACIADQAALPVTAGGTMTPTQYYEKANDLENRIAALIVKLQTIAPPVNDEPALDKAINSVEGQYDLSVKAVEDAQTALESMNEKVQDQYASKYEGLLEELENVKTAFDNAGDNRIVDAADYENQMAVIVAKIGGIKADIATAEANATIYDTLYKGWKAVDDKVQALVEFAETCGVSGIYTVQLEEIKKMCNDKLAYLDEMYADRQLTEATTIDYSAIESYIELTDLQVSKSYGYALSEVADGRIKEVQAWLNEIADNGIKLLPNAAGQNLSIVDQLKVFSADLLKANEDLGKFEPSDYVGANASGTYEEGDESIKQILEEFNRISDGVAELLKTAEDSSYQLGDLNNDGSVSVVDTQLMRQLILQRVTIAELVGEGKARLAYAANIVGNDKIDIADYTALVNIILSDEDGTESYATGMRKISGSAYLGVRDAAQAEGYINVSIVAEENGIRTFAVEINDPEAFVAGQIDFLVESTSRIVDVRGAERLDGHEVEFDSNGESTRVLITSDDNAVFEASQGATLYVDIEGRSGLGFENAIFADRNAQAYLFADKATDTTGIDSIYEGAKAVKEAVYDAAGRVMKSVQRGINIIRHSNGTITKEIRK